jgi:hypothetical protein
MHQLDSFKRIIKGFLAALILALMGSLLSAHSSLAADPRDVTVTLSTWDNLSGVTMMQIAEDKNNPPPAVPYETTTVIRTAADVLYVRIQDRAENWSAWITLVVGGAPVVQTPPQISTPTPSAAPSASQAPAAGGGGGGGGGVGTTWFNLFLSDPDDPMKAYAGDGCAFFVHQLAEGPKTFGPVCASRAGALDFEANDGDFIIRTFEKSRPTVFKEYKAKVTFGTFEVVGAGFRGGSVPRRVITLPRLTDVAPTPTPSPTPTPTPSASAKPTVTATPSATPVVTASASPSASPVVTPARSIPANPYFGEVKSSNVTKVTVKAANSSISQSVKKPLQLVLPATSKASEVAIFIKLPTGRSMTVVRTTSVAGKATSAPSLKFSKPGTYTLTIKVGNTTKTLKVTVK